MIKKLPAIFILIVALSYEANASGWDAFLNCFYDFCNCGISDRDRYEMWDGEKQYKGSKNYVCAPWGKQDGRDDHICLAGQDYPPKHTWYFQRICAESTRESTYFEPKIRIRDQECNFLGCWTTTNTLKSDGECKTLAGPYGLPLTRMCARIAVPGDPLKGVPADPGYTEGKHLDFEGVRKNDEVKIGVDGQPITFRLPKLCAYLDPAFIGVGDDGLDIDLMDLSPSKQPFHKTKELHPVIKVIIFFFDMVIQAGSSLPEMIASLFDMMDGNSGVFTPLVEIFKFVGLIIETIGQLLIEILKEIGQMNRVVSLNDYGCVNVPLGPYPPPFCRQIAPIFETAVTQNICPLGEDGLPVQLGEDGLPVQSTEKVPCVVSNLENNFIRNSIRVGYDNFVPLCRNGENPMVTDSCVTIENSSDSFLSASVLHLSTARKDIIKPCETATPGAPCIKSKLPHTCSVSANGCQDGYRIVYSSNIGKSSFPSNYFFDDLTDCPSSSSVSCQAVWGINRGEFIDVTLLFPPVQTAIDIGPVSTTFSLTSKGLATNFSASIVRIQTFNSTAEFTQDPSQICVVDSEETIGCESRAPFNDPTVHNCASGKGGISCTTDYFKPSFIASLGSGDDRVSALVEPLTTYDDNENTITNSSVNIAGYEFNSFITDDAFVQKPFQGAKALSPASIFGTYKNDASPFITSNTGNTINKDAIYIKGLEYINNEYHRGGKFACLEPRVIERCPTNTKMCVLTTLANKDVVDCNIFMTKSSNYGGLSKCGSDLTGCNLVEKIPGLSSGPGVDIYTCQTGQSCYVHSVNLCTTTYDPASRITPNASFGHILPNNQFYDINGNPGYYYDKKIAVLRNKTPFEMNLCTAIPQPSCSPITSAGPNSANWDEAAIGEYSNGTCPVGVNPLKPMQRYCLINSTAKTIALEDLGDGPECGIGCPAVTTYSASHGNATWTSALAGGTSTGTCKPGLTSSGSLTRLCSPGSPPSLTPIVPGQECKP